MTFSSSTFSLLLLLLLSPFTASLLPTTNFSSFDNLIQTLAFLHRHHHSNRPYHLPLPSNLSSITAIALRLRAADLWLRGRNLGYFRLPPGILTAPHARRTLLVFYDLGNLSSSFFSVPGLVLVAPVIACLAYDASNVSIREVSLRATRDPITIVFPAMDELPGPAQCVRFGLGGSARVGGAVEQWRRCEVRGTGRFSVAVAVAEGKEKGWWVWVWVWVGIMCLVVGIWVGRMRRNRRMEEMVRRGEEGEVLDSVWVRGSKLPVAPATRTTPEIESDSVAWASVL